ncbi:uncharacterized protein LOC143235608 [Tachypleus tridentatus]|uniref:uncharacterized protein LOC143235608 n=1 Tax=Tachypleus tridentatus TaxID=6853 RepID=UPI003FD3BB68
MTATYRLSHVTFDTNVLIIIATDMFIEIKLFFFFNIIIRKRQSLKISLCCQNRNSGREGKFNYVKYSPIRDFSVEREEDAETTTSSTTTNLSEICDDNKKPMISRDLTQSEIDGLLKTEITNQLFKPVDENNSLPEFKV